MNKKILVIFMILLSLMIISNVVAIGVSPGKIQVNYDVENGYNQNFSILAKSNSPTDSYIEVEPSRELAEYITVSDEKIFLPARGVARVNFSLNIPPHADFVGLKEAHIGIYEALPEEGDFLAIRTAVKMRLIVDFPYTGEYVQINNFNIKGVNSGENTEVNWKATSKGLENTKVNSKLMIENEYGEKIYEKSWPQKTLAPKEVYAVQETLETNQYVAGKYKAKLEVKYSDITREKETEFQIGQENINLINHSPKNFSYGTLNEIELEFENNWNGAYNNVYADIKIHNVTAKTSSFNLKPFGKAKVKQFLDTRTLENGTYPVKITAYFGENTANFEIPMEIIKPIEEKESNLTIIIVAVVLIIIIILVVLILIKKKSKKANQRIQSEKQKKTTKTTKTKK
ncbi:hypothetical protein K9L67_00770 [Candidatus Woesearchaeota archaeon]|nr:hypothetical protein [Candidatus Woesearchaeota archaeon]MCF7900739.1 hypothetical protein [Candidatus Woesearchaeota archaeon]MCF8012904.1 hypothetical protein [Candidatus Woesearchaeota archaeon]